MSLSRYPQKPSHKQLKKAASAPRAAKSEANKDFDELTIADAFEQHRSISFKAEARFPRETFYLERFEMGKTVYQEVLSAEFNSFGNYTLEVLRWGDKVWKLALAPDDIVMQLKTAGV